MHMKNVNGVIKLKFSVFTVGTPDYDLEETVKKLKEYGYDGVEWRIGTSLKAEPEVIPPRDRWFWEYNKSTIEVNTILESAGEIKKVCEREGIEIAALATYLAPSDVDRIEEVLQAAVIMECPKIRVSMPIYNSKENYRELFDKTKKEIKILEALAAKYEVKVNFEIHHGTIIPSASAAYRLVEGLKPQYIGIIYDGGNMIHEGLEQHKMGFEILGQYLDHVHIKNAAWLKDHNGWKCGWSTLENGQVNFKTQLSALKAVGYDGYLSFEDFSCEKTTDEKLKENLKFIKNILCEI